MAEAARLSAVICGGVTADGMDWWISYDDQTRDITAFAAGTGTLTLAVMLNNGTIREFSSTPIVNRGPVVVASNAPPRMLAGRIAGDLAGFEHTASWTP